MASNDPLLDDVLAFGEENESKKLLRHPFVTGFHLVFRTVALIIYMFCGFSDQGFIGSFVIIVLLLSVDFWVVKNITGRILVGLRWWNYIDDDGKSHWVYEARKIDIQGRISQFESQIFWTALIIVPIVWAFLFFFAVARFNLKWLMVVCIALSLSGSNMYGYIRCRIGKSEGFMHGISNLASGFFQKHLITNLFKRSPPTTIPSSNI